MTIRLGIYRTAGATTTPDTTSFTATSIRSAIIKDTPNYFCDHNFYCIVIFRPIATITTYYYYCRYDYAFYKCYD